ncbi:MAG TPA: hypothetical protein VMZ53_15165 [Kofleriaceae bacterium]|nr:hypothetical protein [Kofleriaceae bacterium]
MRKLRVAVAVMLVACDRGSAKQPPPAPAPRDATAARLDASPVDAHLDDAPAVDAMVLAPPKPAALQTRDCTKIAKRHLGRTYSNEERREYDEIIRKRCVETPWSATVVDCLVKARADDAFACFDLLPADQKKQFDAESKESFCKYNDCIPHGIEPNGAEIDL